MVRVAVIGGGIAGLSCASRLQELLGARSCVTVYDTGKRGPGGRASSRLWQDDVSRPVDHAVQFAEVHTPAFSNFMEGNFQITNKPGRVEDIVDMISLVLAKGLSNKQLRGIQGKAIYAEGHTFARLSAPCVHSISSWLRIGPTSTGEITLRWALLDMAQKFKYAKIELSRLAASLPR